MTSHYWFHSSQAFVSNEEWGVRLNEVCYKDWQMYPSVRMSVSSIWNRPWDPPRCSSSSKPTSSTASFNCHHYAEIKSVSLIYTNNPKRTVPVRHPTRYTVPDFLEHWGFRQTTEEVENQPTPREWNFTR